MTRTAIAIKRLSCTATRPDRLQASTLSDRPTRIISSFWAFDDDEARYTAALQALLTKMGSGWGDVSQWVAGGTAEGRVYVRVDAGRKAE